ncbi:MAG: hypothetical protein HC898_07565 [Phycisphaerales bacterium]|nr:hypothetical protein [Phycisphaerales bacterium]
MQTDQVIFREFTGPDGRARAQAQFQLSDWPSELPITQALAGLQGVFLQVSPIQLSGTATATEPADKPVTQTWPLVEITGPDIWADTQFDRFPDIQRDPAKAADRYIVGVAAQKQSQRLAVFSDPAWATDSIIDYGPLGPGTASLTRALFPANAELFVNTVQWLAGMENLIAAGARTQDIRRIMPLTSGQRIFINWVLLAGLPVLVIVTGIAVGLARRKA